ncbi:unnamed protein product [Paramecium sonneborni]|uniref:Kinase domain protein n=1 Tax=Paramecium sonneborni TaxID=65129 RepID=A0A8S1KKP6_9CILI|nr:unnamed protein product [Paramecium sonneborni]
MSLSSYEIDLPVNKESPYQQLYRGRHDNNQIYMLHIFPKQTLNNQIQDQILQRAEELRFIFEKMDFEDFILISYQDSTLWINLEQKIKTETLKSFYVKLYQQYSKLKGIIDFDQDYVFVNEDEVFIIDYGINQHITKKHKDYEYTTKTKTYLFGQLIFNLLCNRDISEKLLQCSEQYQIDVIIHQAAENYKINIEILECLFKMLKLDPNQRPTFEEVGQWKLFYSKKDISKVTTSILDFSNKKIGTQTSRQNQTQRSARPQSYDQKVLNTAHNQSVKAAIQKQRRQVPSTNKVCSSYVFASQIISNNIKNKKLSSNFTNLISTQQSYFQQTGFPQQVSEMNQSQYPKTQNHFFSKQPDLLQQTAQKSFKEFNHNQQQQRIEKKSPFLFDGSQPPIIGVTKPLNSQPTTDQNKNQNYEANFFSNNYSNQTNYTSSQQNIHQNENTLQQQYQKQQQQQQQQQQSIPIILPKQQQNQVTEDNSSFHFKSLPSETSNQNQKLYKDEKQQAKLKTPFQLAQNINENDLDDIKLHQMNNQNYSQEQTQPADKEKKQEILKKPQQDNKLTSNSTFSKKEDKQNVDNYITNHKTNEKPQSINDIEEPPIIRPNKSLQQDIQKQKPTVENTQNTKVNQEDLEKTFNEYQQKYYSYLAIIQNITFAVADLSEKLSFQGQIWIVPLCIVFKRAYEIRKITEKDIEKQKNIFELKEFLKFKSSTQYQLLQQTIVQQNKMMEKEFSEMLEVAQKNISRLDANSQQKMSALLNLDIKKSIKEQAEKYLFTQLYPRVKTAIGKLRAKTLANNTFSELEWMQTRLLSLYSILIMELELYTCESNLFKEVTLKKYRKMQNIDEIEQHCNQIENTINTLPIFIK